VVCSHATAAWYKNGIDVSIVVLAWLYVHDYAVYSLLIRAGRRVSRQHICPAHAVHCSLSQTPAC
jgi:hypothetical protein